MNINTEEREILRQRFSGYISESVRSKECHDDIGIMVYPVVREKYMGKQFPVKDVIEEIRADSDYLLDKPKWELPAIFFSVAGFTGNKELQNVTEHTGLIVVDIDVKDNPDTDFKQLKKEFSQDKYVYACFRSPSGGLKVVFNTNLQDIKHHKAYFHSLFKHVTITYPEIVRIDTSGSNVNRACFMPYDKDVYFNPYSFRYCLSNQRIAEISDEIVNKKLYSNSLKVILQVDDYSFEDHYNNILNLLINQTSVGLGYKEKRTSMGIDDIQDATSKSNASSEKRTSVGLYDSVFNKYRFNNIQDYIMRTDVPFFETALWKHSYPYKLDYKTFLDENYFTDNTQEPISTENTLGFEDTDGIDFCEVIIPENGIQVGYRHKTLASFSMKFIFNNPFCHPKRLVEHMQHLTHKHCLNPEPDTNPKPSDEEVKNIVMQNYQKFISGELDFNKAIRKNDKTGEIMKKYVFHSRKYVDICSSYTKQRARNCFTEGRREKNIRRYTEAITTLMNGTKITYKGIAGELNMSERHLRRIRNDEDYQEFFEIQKKLIMNYNSSIKKTVVNNDMLDLGSGILDNSENILKRDSKNKTDEDYNLSDDQKNQIFNRVYTGILSKNDNFGRDELLQLFCRKLDDIEQEDRKVLSINPDSITDSDTFWKQERLERMLLSLYIEVNPKIN